MPPRPSHKGQVMTRSQSESETQSSQEQVEQDMLKTARELVAANKRRRAAKRKSIEEEHRKQTKDITARINALFEGRRNRVAKMQKAQWDRLADLNKRRSDLEAQILTSMKSIEKHTTNIAIQLSAVFEGRAEAIQSSLGSQKA